MRSGGGGVTLPLLLYGTTHERPMMKIIDKFRKIYFLKQNMKTSIKWDMVPSLNRILFKYFEWTDESSPFRDWVTNYMSYVPTPEIAKSQLWWANPDPRSGLGINSTGCGSGPSLDPDPVHCWILHPDTDFYYYVIMDLWYSLKRKRGKFENICYSLKKKSQNDKRKHSYGLHW